MLNFVKLQVIDFSSSELAMFSSKDNLTSKYEVKNDECKLSKRINKDSFLKTYK